LIEKYAMSSPKSIMHFIQIFKVPIRFIEGTEQLHNTCLEYMYIVHYLICIFVYMYGCIDLKPLCTLHKTCLNTFGVPHACRLTCSTYVHDLHAN